MNKEIIKRLPNWINTVGQYCLCLSDDLDSLFSCYYLTKYKKWNIKYFYDFYNIYAAGNEILPQKETIAVDADLVNGKCFGNHVGQYEDNPNCINLNKYNNITQYNYTEKFAGSTLITVLSILNVDINKFTEEQQAILLCIDSMFLSYYFSKSQASYYIDTILGYKKLIDILEKHDKQYFYNLQDKYKLKEKIYLDGWGLLQTDIKLDEISTLFNIKLELPQMDFDIVQELEVHKGYYAPGNIDIFSLARTYKNSVIYSTIK
ncbi:hypothetical protein [Clostridium tyrobutyricum]|uniref:hypothetical protein n=1 Tax=Clostridium tyrobutyricum TaxID=1519 RepID=UPI0018A0B96E|nr:hypothetical protein [Clostridium tyrobutyricum]